MMDTPKCDNRRNLGLCDTQHPCEFTLEVQKCALCGGFLIEVAEGTGQEVVKFRGGVVMFGGEFEEFYEIRAQPEARIVFSQSVASVVQFGFAK